MFKTYSLLLAMLLLLSGCVNPYKKGVDYDGFPDKEIPIYDDSIVFEFEDDKDEWTLSFGSEDDIEDIADFYLESFDDSDYVIEKLEVDKDDYVCEGYVISDEYYFEIEGEEADKDAEAYFDYVFVIKVEETDLPDDLSDNEPNNPNTETIVEEPTEVTQNEPSVSIDGTLMDLGYLTITVLDDWNTMDIPDGIQLYKDDLVLQISLQGYGLDEDYLYTFVEASLSSDDEPVSIENLWGYDFVTGRYWAGSYHQTVHATIFNEEGQMLVVNIVGASEGVIPEEIQMMLNSVLMKE